MTASAFRSVALLLSAGVAFAGCGGDKESTGITGGGGSDTAPTKTATPAPTTAPTTQPTAKDAGAPVTSNSGLVMEGTIAIGDSGATLTWSGAGEPCGATKCRDADLKFSSTLTFALKGCCAEDNTCGVDLTEVGGSLGLKKAGCEAFAKAGSVDSACPASTPIQAILLQAQSPGTQVTLDGCCQANGECGYVADFVSLGFGCVAPERFGQQGGTACTYTP